MAKSKTSRKPKNISFMPKPDDEVLIQALGQKFVVSRSGVVRMAIHRWAEAEGIKQSNQAVSLVRASA